MNTHIIYIFSAIFLFAGLRVSAQKEINFAIQLTPSSRLDTLCLDILSEFSPSGSYSLKVEQTLTKISQNGIFNFRLPEKNAPFYITIRSPDTPDRIPMTWETHTLYQYLVMPGDNLIIKYDEKSKTVTFAGKGYHKYMWRYNNDIMVSGLKRNLYYSGIKANRIIEVQETILSKAIQSLDSIKSSIPLDEYQILRANIIGYQMGQIVLNLAFLNFHWISGSDSYSDKKEADNHIRGYENRFMQKFDDSSSYLINSSSWPTFLYHRAVAQKAYDQLKGNSKNDNTLDYIKHYPASPMRDKAIILSLFNSKSTGQLTEVLLNNAFASISTNRYRKIARGIFGKIAEGSQIDTSFRFTDNNGRQVKLREYKNHNVLIDMWFTGCIPCIEVANQLPKIERSLIGLDLIFVSLSVDKRKDDWLKSITPKDSIDDKFSNNHFTTAETKYLYTSGTGSVNSFIKSYNPAGSYPCLILIGKEGKVLSTNLTAPTDEKRAKIFLEEIRIALSGSKSVEEEIVY